jgi:hypothetical protein
MKHQSQPINAETSFPNDSLDSERENALKVFDKAKSLFPCEAWIQVSERIFMAESRTPKSDEQREVLAKELIQARLLEQWGRTVYLLPEKKEFNVKHPDAIVDDTVMEFKTITGGIRQIGERFNEAREKADTVFFKINSALSKREVARKLAGVISKRGYTSGKVIAYFTETEEVCYWNVDGLT